ncbi:hypothetical protein [Hymenobacter actinosclerus]|uniref:Conjugal transfer protein TraI n=1 Tax=Hymenobacter actinosclerus TaxID=82805 RepID=A0A1I0IJF1_9BACT|nr:hypothetical protein [Hymenobacter actinosclerus]SET97169.1 hypothetical protein SAMN04487998_3339 [Hymenobacter actinosclerus]
MKTSTTLLSLLTLGLALLASPSFAQLPIISAPIAEKSSRKQIVHQGVSATLLGQGKGLAADVKRVSGQIKGVIDKTQALHEQWYSSLLQISAGVRNYRRVKEIYTHQGEMISQFASAIPDLRTRQLTPTQLSEAASVYQALLQENVALLGELAGVLSSSKAKMTDPERIEFIDNIADRIAGQHELMDYFGNKCRAIAQLQAQQRQDRAAMQAFMTAR